MSVDALFQSFQFKGLHLKNRIVMAPMTRSFSPGGVITDEMAQYYARRAAGEVGLIVSEGTGVERPLSLNDPAVPRFHGAPETDAWKRVIDGVHAKGGAMAPQLWHVGAMPSHTPGYDPELESPSGLSAGDKPIGSAMSEENVADAIQAFATGAADAKRLGFDAVELHGAHGYLIDQFFWGETNRREDAYGSKDLPGRARFAADITKAIRKEVGPDYPLILRISQWKQQNYAAKLAGTPAELEAWLKVLVDAGVDILHCSQRRFWEPEFEGSDLNFAGWAKKLTGQPTITVGSVGLDGDSSNSWAGKTVGPASLDEVVRRLDRGDFDLVAVGRALLQDPDWAAKVRTGRQAELKPFEAQSMKVLF